MDIEKHQVLMIKNWSFSFFCVGLLLFLSSFIKNDTDSPSAETFVVVLDAGHGGHDPGNLGNGYLEKDIALSIVLKAGAELEKVPGIKVVYTRDTDVFVDLYRRGEIANEHNADLFVSVHCDSHTSDAHGAGTFVMGLHTNKQNFNVAKKENSVIYLEDNYEDKYSQYNINSPESLIGMTIMQEEYLEQSMQFAGLLQQNFIKQLKRKDRKVKQAGFIVLHQTFMPSVLVETGFLTNSNEGAYLNSKKGQQEMGKAIADAVIAYKNGVQNTSVSSTAAPKSKPVEEKPVVELEKKPEEKMVAKVEEEKTPVKMQPKPKIEKKTISTIDFRVQLLATAKVIPLNSENFNGLKTLTKESYKNLYRYMYGNTGSFERAKELQLIAQANGFKDCYIVAYKDGVRIPVKEAVKLAAIR